MDWGKNWTSKPQEWELWTDSKQTAAATSPIVPNIESGEGFQTIGNCRLNPVPSVESGNRTKGWGFLLYQQQPRDVTVLAIAFWIICQLNWAPGKTVHQLNLICFVKENQLDQELKCRVELKTERNLQMTLDMVRMTMASKRFVGAIPVFLVPEAAGSLLWSHHCHQIC